MDTSSDQGQGVPLSPTATRMLELRGLVFDVWEERVRALVSQARLLQQPLLFDTLPAFYDNIAYSVTPDYPRVVAVDGSTVAAEHGGERARLTTYDHRALIEEYQSLRWAILDVLQRENVALSRPELHTINASIDLGIQQAIEAFTLVHTGLRERLAAALTQDLRGPLSATATALELILQLDDPAQIKAVAAKALENVQRVSGLADEILHTMAFHAGQQVRLQLTHVDILDIVKEIQAKAITAFGQRFEVAERSVMGWWDRAALKQAIENLVANATKYGRPNATIRISIDTNYGRLILGVRNEAEPIPLAEQEAIFQLYRRAEAAASGSEQSWGIGLPYVRAVAESHAGSVTVDSSAGRGTTFIIDLPIDIRPYLPAPTLA